MSSIFRNVLKLRKVPQYMRALLFKRVILVFQMGRVGSHSVYFPIRRLVQKQDRGIWQGGWCYGETENTILAHYHKVSEISKWVGSIISWRARLGLPVNIICPIREPIARDVSAFFYFVCTLPRTPANADLGELEELFLADSRTQRGYRNTHRTGLAEYSFTLNWFDKFFRPLTRIDVYKKPFPIDRKWQIYRRGFTRVLVYRVDLELSEQTKLVSRFLEIKLDEIKPINRGKDKACTELYSRFRESVKLPEHYIGRMHNSRFAQHFWSPQELNVAADKWRVAPSN